MSVVGSGLPPRWSIRFPSAGSCSPTSRRTSRPRAWWRSCVSASARPSMLPSWRVLGARGDPSLGGPAEPHHTFPACRTERQYRDLAYCVSQLPLTERGLRKMLDNFDCFGDKLSDESIFSAFLSILGKLRRGAKPEGKVRGACCFQAAAHTGVLRLQVSDLIPS